MFILVADEGGVVNVLEPHPHFPYLAVSGLDNDVKVFIPTAEKPVDLTSQIHVGNPPESLLSPPPIRTLLP